MVYVMMYAENADIVGTYDSRDAALADLADVLRQEPDLVDEIGLRPFEDGHPAGVFQTAGELLASQLPQQRLDIASS